MPHLFNIDGRIADAAWDLVEEVAQRLPKHRVIGSFEAEAWHVYTPDGETRVSDVFCRFGRAEEEAVTRDGLAAVAWLRALALKHLP